MFSAMTIVVTASASRCWCRGESQPDAAIGQTPHGPKDRSWRPRSPIRGQGNRPGSGPINFQPTLENFFMSTNLPQPSYAYPARLILILAIAPAIGLGMCRFAYALVLPDMLDSLGWSYSIAGFMNTMNAAGYLAGALMANAVIRRLGLFNSVRISAAACVLSLFLSALTGQVVIFSIARLLSGIAAAFAFISAGA